MLENDDGGPRDDEGIRTDEVAVLEVVAIQLLEGILRIHDVPEDNICCALRID